MNPLSIHHLNDEELRLGDETTEADFRATYRAREGIGPRDRWVTHLRSAKGSTAACSAAPAGDGQDLPHYQAPEATA
jgi:hypothetical protein